MTRPLPIALPFRFGVFTRAEALAAGWTDSALKHAVRHGRIVRVTKGCFVATETWAGDGPDDDRRRLMIRTVAAQLRIRDSAASHSSAAVLAELPLWRTPKRACVTVRPYFSGDAVCAHLHRARLPAQQVLVAEHGLRTRTARTILDIAREHDVEDAVVAGDAALARRMTSEDRLLACAAFCHDWPGIRRAERVLGLLDARSESPLESISRIRLPAVGIPAPEPQVEILSPGGILLGRLDFYWDEFGVAGEVDGTSKYRDDPLLTIIREKRRQGPMDELGLIFVRWGRVDIEDMPTLARRLNDTFARASRRPRSDRNYIARSTAGFVPRLDAHRVS